MAQPHSRRMFLGFAAQAEAATTAMANAYTNGSLDQTAFNAAVNRVSALRAGLF